MIYNPRLYVLKTDDLQFQLTPSRDIPEYFEKINDVENNKLCRSYYLLIPQS